MSAAAIDEPVTIVVLGPMEQVRNDRIKKASRTRKLRKLIRQIAAEIEADESYKGPKLEVAAPEDRASGVIVPGVLELIETAELVVLDVSGGRPNVAYEAGIIHALGLPHIFITSDSEPPFYFKGESVIANFASAKRFTPGRKSHEALRDIIRAFVDEGHMAPRLADNQITRFFELPIIDIAGPSGLASAYYKNSIRRFIRRRGYVDRVRTVTWKTSAGEEHAKMKMRALIAVQPDDILLEDGDRGSDEMHSTLRRLKFTVVTATIHRREDDPDDIRNFGCGLLARRIPGKITKPLAPGIVVERPSILYPLARSPRIHKLEERSGDRRYKRGFGELRKRRLQQMMDSFWRNVRLQAQWDGKDGARLLDFVACRQLTDLAGIVETAIDSKRFRTETAWRNPLTGT